MAWFKNNMEHIKDYHINIKTFHCKVWPRFLTSSHSEGFKNICSLACPCNADPFWSSCGGVTGLMRTGQLDSVFYSKETQGAQQALLFCFHVVSRTNSVLTIQKPLYTLCLEFRAFLCSCVRELFLRYLCSSSRTWISVDGCPPPKAPTSSER